MDRTEPAPDDPRQPQPTVPPSVNGVRREFLAGLATWLMLLMSIPVVFLGLLSPMAFDACATGVTYSYCRYNTLVPAMLILGPIVSFVAGTLAVWFHSRGRPRLVVFLPWTLTLVLLVVGANNLADGRIF